ncbi:MAG: YebC/PmpR family DNA-binding transcriptional regulator [Leptolyngbya sp. ERB_1_1]
MAGHSKWANIKRQKARVDAKRANIFTKVSREIIVAARNGVPDPAGNFQLRTAIEKAKAAGIPNENIDRAIAKGSGKLGSDAALESIQYEGYGAGGVAVLIEALTDNRNRTAADLREAFSKNGGNLGETGCVGWMFEQKGIVELSFAPQKTGRGRKIEEVAINEEALLEACLEGGADSYELIETEDGQAAEIFTEVENLESLSHTLKEQGYTVAQVELRWIPQNTIEVTDPDHARALLKLMDALDSLDDVQNATANFDIAEELMMAAIE